jgi:hypothetical protein
MRAAVRRMVHGAGWSRLGAYNPATGVYGRQAAVYGPNSGVGAWSGYNTSPGTYAHGRAAWDRWISTNSIRTTKPGCRVFSASRISMPGVAVDGASGTSGIAVSAIALGVEVSAADFAQACEVRVA